ncbi:MAG TPA: PhzF family phenazine biosynthesis protein [Geminicoccaceae bacterium]|nr:PhzF family phenazine biosynthesis protein [Geminicoccaceae bacterium]
MRYRFVTADVFTDRAFGGNPLAVLLDAGGLADQQMQAVAREFNLSETVFVLPPDDPAHTRQLRIFTPAQEVPFAGHPTVGSALILAATGALELAGESTRITFEERAGPVPVTIRAAGGRASFAQLTAPAAPEVRLAPAPDAIAALLSLTPAELSTDGGLPAFVSCGLPFLIVELRDAAALGRARPDLAVWPKLLGDAWATGAYLITRDADAADADFRVRMFAPTAGVAEDPATGSAAAALGGWLGLRETPPEGTQRRLIAQGIEMGRPSRLEVEIEKRAGTVTAVRVGGSAVLVSEGTIEVPATG